MLSSFDQPVRKEFLLKKLVKKKVQESLTFKNISNIFICFFIIYLPNLASILRISHNLFISKLIIYCIHLFQRICKKSTYLKNISSTEFAKLILSV